MDKSKQAAFVLKMGKKRLRFAKGGKVKREHFDGGGIAGLLGAAGGLGGTGFSAPSGTNANQLNTLYNQNQTALQNQNNMVGAVQPQTTQAVNAQGVLSGQFANQAMGQGPNVAQNVLNQATGANVANQAALMAGQRGASANPALIARQAAMAGAGAQQQAAGQAATMQAQQQIAAQQAQAQLAANQINQAQAATNAGTTAAQGEQGILQGANTAANNIQGQLANTGLQGQQSVLGGFAKSLSSGLAGLFAEGGEVPESHPAHPAHGHKKLDFIHKMAKMGMEHFDSGGIAVPQVNVSSPAPMPVTNIPQVQGGFTPTFNQGAADLAKAFEPGEKKAPPPPAKLGTTENSTDVNITGGGMDTGGFGSELLPVSAGGSDDMKPMAAHGGMMDERFQGPHKSMIANYCAHGGKVPAMVSPGEIYLDPEKVDAVIKGVADPLKVGERIPGEAKVKGDSYKNDTVQKDLDEGGVVVDRENAMDSKKASKFVHKAIAKHKAGRK